MWQLRAVLLCGVRYQDTRRHDGRARRRRSSASAARLRLLPGDEDFGGAGWRERPSKLAVAWARVQYDRNDAGLTGASHAGGVTPDVRRAAGQVEAVQGGSEPIPALRTRRRREGFSGWRVVAKGGTRAGRRRRVPGASTPSVGPCPARDWTSARSRAQDSRVHSMYWDSCDAKNARCTQPGHG
jgi:hypothetical protein